MFLILVELYEYMDANVYYVAPSARIFSKCSKASALGSASSSVIVAI